MADGFSVEARDLEALAVELRRSASVFREEMDKTVWAIGAEVAATAKGIASEHSKSIPPTIKAEPLPGAVAVTGGSDEVPLGALYELGDTKSKRKGKTFRHPVFGNRKVWVEQPRYEYLRPAVAVDRRAITRRMEKAWDAALRVAGLHAEGEGEA